MSMLGDSSSRLAERGLVAANSALVKCLESSKYVINRNENISVAPDESPEAENTDSQSLGCVSAKEQSDGCLSPSRDDEESTSGLNDGVGVAYGSEATYVESSALERVLLKASLSFIGGERFTMRGVWTYGGDVMGNISFASSVGDFDSIDSEQKRPDDDISSRNADTSIASAVRIGERRLFCGQFTMANPEYVASKRKKRAARKVLGVSEKFVLSVDRNAVEDSMSPDETVNSDKIIKCCGDGFNRFGCFSISGSLNISTGELVAVKDYWPKTADGTGFISQQHSHGKVPFAWKVDQRIRAARTPVYTSNFSGIRSSKRQRIPNKNLHLDVSGTKNYAFIARYGSGEGLSPYEYALATGEPYMKQRKRPRSGPLSPVSTTDSKIIGSYEYDRSLYLYDSLSFDFNNDAIAVALATKVRKKARSKTLTLVRSLLQQQADFRAAWRAMDRSNAAATEAVASSVIDLTRNASYSDLRLNGQLYMGELINGMRHGLGTIVLENGAVVDGRWVYGRLHGKGVFINPSGSLVYQGGFIDGSYAGFGTYFFEDGSRYDGDFKDGVFHGYGVFRSEALGFTYSGDWVRGKREGVGHLIFKNGSSYAGGWHKNRWSGHGELKMKEILRYEGCFKAGKFEGRGLCEYAGHGSFEGNFRNGMKEGRGRYSFGNGAVYEGRFSQDKVDGFGTLEVLSQRAVHVNDNEYIIPVKLQSSMKFVNRAAGF